jgi:hypothetical protein
MDPRPSRFTDRLALRRLARRRQFTEVIGEGR